MFILNYFTRTEMNIEYDY